MCIPWLAECDEASQGGLLSPGSTAGFASDRHLEPAQSEDWGGSWTPLESTPGGPRVEYSLDDPEHIVARQQSGTLSRDAEHVDSSETGVRASYKTDGPHRGGAAYLSAARLAIIHSSLQSGLWSCCNTATGKCS